VETGNLSIHNNNNNNNNNKKHSIRLIARQTDYLPEMMVLSVAGIVCHHLFYLAAAAAAAVVVAVAVAVMALFATLIRCTTHTAGPPPKARFHHCANGTVARKLTSTSRHSTVN